MKKQDSTIMTDLRFAMNDLFGSQMLVDQSIHADDITVILDEFDIVGSDCICLTHEDAHIIIATLESEGWAIEF